MNATLPTLLVAAFLATPSLPALSADSCGGTLVSDVGGKIDKNTPVKAWKLDDGGIAAYSRMNINIDGYARAYHRRNREAGAVLHLCVGARVWLPDGTGYEGSKTNAICTGRFMEDLARIEAAGWTDPAVGVVQWYGVVAEGSVKIAGKTISGVKPFLQRDGSGFYVSPTSLVDKSVTDRADQRRYVNPLRVPGAVVPSSVLRQGVALGSFGVAINPKGKAIAVPFVVFDAGPAVGEGSPALARQVAGRPLSDEIDLRNRFEGQVDAADVLWVFFGGPAQPFDHTKEAQVTEQAKAAFERWGGQARLDTCVKTVPRP